MTLGTYLRSQDLTGATIPEIQQHALDYCDEHGIDGIVPYQAYHEQPRDAWDIQEYLDTAHFKSHLLELQLHIPELTRNQLLIHVLRG